MKKLFNSKSNQKLIGNVIDGKFKVLVPLKKEIKELMNLCHHVNINHQQFNHLYEEDKKLYAEQISGSDSIYQTGLNMKH